MTTKNDDDEMLAKKAFLSTVKALLALVLILLVVAGLVSIPWWIAGVSKGVKLISSILIFGILYLGAGKGK